ncbi:MAG: glutamate racemase [Vicinamibacterales bacterium]
MDSTLPIGVFDSGVGGLTVLRALRESLPHESAIYLGDTARLPYGTKSEASVIRYATQATEHLVGRGIKLLVIACNTASAVSLDPIRQRFAPLPVVGVVEPGAEAAVAASRHQRHLVLATESTVKRHAYARAIRTLAPDAVVEEIACSLLVALAEEGWTEGSIAESIAREYVSAVFTRPPAAQPETVVLGCTHFPLLASVIRRVVGPAPALVDSASTTAAYVAGLLGRSGLLNTKPGPGDLRLLATDGADRFAAVGARFLREPMTAGDVEIVDL